MSDDAPDTQRPSALEHARDTNEMKRSRPEGAKRPDIDRALLSLERVRAIVAEENTKQTRAQRPIVAAFAIAIGTMALVMALGAKEMLAQLDGLRKELGTTRGALELRLEQVERNVSQNRERIERIEQRERNEP